MKPNVLLLNLPYIIHNIDVNRPKVRSYLGFPYGLLSIATFCCDLANIRIIDCDAEPDWYASILWTLSQFQPDIVGLSMMFDNSYGHVEKITKTIRYHCPESLIVMGGAAASYSWQEIIEEQEDVDAICFGEGEIPFRKLLKRLICEYPHSAYKPFLLSMGLLLSRSGEFVSWATRNRVREPQPIFIEDLDTVIDLDYSFVNPSAYDMQEAFSPYAREHRKCFFISTSRGCPFACQFCSNSTIHGKKVRQASVDAIIAHVEKLVRNYGMETLIIYDDQLLYNKDRAKELFRRLAPFKIRIEMPNGLSVAFIDEELAGLMKAAGVDTVYLAIENGSEYVLKELIHKPLKLHMVKPAVRWLQEVGIFVHAFIVLGMPGESDSHRKETEAFLLDVGVNWAGINLATPVRGSQLYDDCIKNGWIQKQKIGDIVDKKYIINYPGQDPAEVERQAYEMNLNINFHNNLDMKQGNYERAAACFRQVIQRYGGHEIAREYLKICERKLNGNL